MRRAVLSIAVLLGIATLAVTAEAQATPSVSATITIESDRVQVAGGRGGHHDYHRGPGPYRHQGWARHGWHHRPRHHQGWAPRRFHGRPVVIIQPAPRFHHHSWAPPAPHGFAPRHHW